MQRIVHISLLEDGPGLAGWETEGTTRLGYVCCWVVWSTTSESIGKMRMFADRPGRPESLPANARGRAQSTWLNIHQYTSRMTRGKLGG